MLTSEALQVIGVPPVPIGAMRSMGVSGSSAVTLRRHYAANPEDRSLSCRFYLGFSSSFHLHITLISFKDAFYRHFTDILPTFYQHHLSLSFRKPRKIYTELSILLVETAHFTVECFYSSLKGLIAETYKSVRQKGKRRK